MNIKKCVFSILSFLLILLLSACHTEKVPDESIKPQDAPKQPDICGVWLSCYELSHMLRSGSEDEFRAEIGSVLGRCIESGINNVFIQVRPFADSVYPSDIYPASEYIISSLGEIPEFDVLEVFVELAHAEDISVHAWINPYRISYKTKASELSSNSIALNGEYKDGVVFTSVGVYLDPSSIQNQSLVLSGVREILDNYDVDGIHIDDYFYPVTDESFDESSYSDYCEKGGRMSLAQWRRENDNCLVSSIYSLVHSYEGKLFSISPAGDIDKNRNVYYADVKLWLSEEGYADLIIPQIYFGFEHEDKPFEKIAKKWLSLKRADGVRLACGLALYKQGAEDELAGKASKEWIDNSDVIERQIEYVNSSDYCGYVLFSYGDL